MATKKPKAKRAAEAAQDPEFQKILDTVPMPGVTRTEELLGNEGMRRLGRFMMRVQKWIEAKPSSDVAMRLSLEIWRRRAVEKDWFLYCETLAEDRALVAYQRKNARKGKGFRHWPDVKECWIKWQKRPSLYASMIDFKAAMEVKFPGCNPGTLQNQVTKWKRELDTQNGES
jgi:hypothetical protein